MAAHHCHARGCTVKVAPEMLMCRTHWRLVPRTMQNAVWRSYRPGQCDDRRPSEAWHEAADTAILYVELHEARDKQPHAGAWADAMLVESTGSSSVAAPRARGVWLAWLRAKLPASAPPAPAALFRRACHSYEGCMGAGWRWDSTDSGSGAQVYCDCLAGVLLRETDRKALPPLDDLPAPALK